jgi:hypothetical protein
MSLRKFAVLLLSILRYMLPDDVDDDDQWWYRGVVRLIYYNG